MKFEFFSLLFNINVVLLSFAESQHTIFTKSRVSKIKAACRDFWCVGGNGSLFSRTLNDAP